MNPIVYEDPRDAIAAHLQQTRYLHEILKNVSFNKDKNARGERQQTSQIGTENYETEDQKSYDP